MAASTSLLAPALESDPEPASRVLPAALLCAPNPRTHVRWEVVQNGPTLLHFVPVSASAPDQELCPEVRAQWCVCRLVGPDS